MGKFLIIVCIVIALLFSLAGMATALTNAQAGLVQAQANAAQTSANLATQCVSGLMVLVALIAGGAVGMAITRFRAGRQELIEKQGGIYRLPPPVETLEVSDYEPEDVLFKTWFS